MNFTYRWGQRPLDGFTLKRGLGKGGFGEVYFALSDGGKEAALKLIRGQGEIELRGIANCLNLKHPHLVHLYDLRADAQGDRWLVMEYIQGESLSAILQRSPRGLPEPQARDWFLQIARAVAYLHDHAVVHRDIKPANVFIEEGIAKLGDYGLSKSVESSQHAQSSNVGTIHYMAPEVASGTYSKQIDIYACGVMLYEMLTGTVPFKGQTWAEIALKHQTDIPDMRRVPAAYVPILEQALNKKADRRFADMNAMIQAVVAVGQPVERLQQPPLPAPMPTTATPVQPRSGQATGLISSLLLVPLFALPTTAVWGIVTGQVHWGTLGSIFLIMVAGAWSVLLAAKFWEGQKTSQPRRWFLGACGALVGCLAFWLNGWTFPEIWQNDDPLPPGFVSYWGGALRGQQNNLEMLCGYVIFFGLAMMLPRWWLSAETARSERFSLFPLFATALWGLFLLAVWKNMVITRHVLPPDFLIVALAGTAAIVQLASPNVPPVSTRRSYRQRLMEGRLR